MKAILNKLILIASFVFVFVACNDQMGETDSRLTAVSALTEPADGKAIQLLPSASASIYFEWEYCNVEESGTAIYQIAFDKIDGDFSNPVYLLSADNNGYYNHVYITHKQMNKIAGMMGIGASETGTFKWAVFSSKGTKAMKSGEERKITITRLAGIEAPVETFVTGEGSEGGTDVSKAHKMNYTGNGIFEVYTKLTAGKPFYFTDRAPGTPRIFYTQDGVVKEQEKGDTDGTVTVSTGGIYKITIDFETGACSYTLVTRLGLFFSPENTIIFDLDYQGYGVWKASGKPLSFFQESWGRDERYKFRMFVKENSGAASETEWEWGTLNGTDSRPTSASPESYYYVKLVTPSQWDNKWKFAGEMDNAKVDVTFYLQADKPYTHEVKKVGDL